MKGIYYVIQKQKTYREREREREERLLMNFVIICDFDGTITKMDTGQALLNELADGDWKKYDELVIKGEIGTRQALIKQYGLVATTEEEYTTIVQSIKVDETFIGFFDWIKKKEISFYVISDGFQSYIEKIFRNHGIDPTEITILSNEMEIKDNKIELKFNTEPCEHGCANCKISHVKKLKERYDKVIYIGDGLSDILPAKKCADIIFARKNKDLSHVLEGDKRLINFSNFNEIKREIMNYPTLKDGVFKKTFK